MTTITLLLLNKAVITRISIISMIMSDEYYFADDYGIACYCHPAHV